LVFLYEHEHYIVNTYSVPLTLLLGHRSQKFTEHEFELHRVS